METYTTKPSSCYLRPRSTTPRSILISLSCTATPCKYMSAQRSALIFNPRPAVGANASKWRKAAEAFGSDIEEEA